MNVVLMIALIATMVTAALLDVRGNRIPNFLTVGAVFAALAVRAVPDEPGLVSGLTGLGLAFALVLPLFGLKMIGGGDAKLLMAAGAFLGPLGFVTAILYTAVAGGILALCVAVYRKDSVGLLRRSALFAFSLATLSRRAVSASLENPEAITIPYGVAIAVGASLAWFLPLVVV